MKITDILVNESVDAPKRDSLVKKANAAWQSSAKHKSGKYTEDEHREFVHNFIHKDVTEVPENMPSHIFKRQANRSYAKTHLGKDSQKQEHTASGQSGSGVEPASKEVRTAAAKEGNVPNAVGHQAVKGQREQRKAARSKKADQTAVSDATRINDGKKPKTNPAQERDAARRAGSRQAAHQTNKNASNLKNIAKKGKKATDDDSDD